MAKKLTFVYEGTVDKLAITELGNNVVERLMSMLNLDGTFKDAKIQKMFEDWKQTPEGKRYA